MGWWLCLWGWCRGAAAGEAIWSLRLLLPPVCGREEGRLRRLFIWSG
jgi:hypothetical protein